MTLEATEKATQPVVRLPRRAWNLAMRVLELERECNRRGRLTLDIIFIDGEWLLGVTKPGPVERLGE